jgi:hypothetical protein
MGCDGGSIPTRCELVKTKKKQERADPNEITRVKWTLCALSKEPLAPPIVACPQGQLFNKEAVITHLLQKTMPSAFSYIKGMKARLPISPISPPPLHENFCIKFQKSDFSLLGSALCRICWC